MRIAGSQLDYHVFRFNKAEIDTFFPEPCFRDVINTGAFKRLASIHFLGAIDYLMLGGNKGVEIRHTRYDHSLAVANLARRFVLAKELPEKESNAIIVAALLHDIGHAPLSHSLEPAFKSIFEIDHHKVGERILRGDVQIGIRLARALQRHRINNIEIMAIIAGYGEGSAKDLFSRSINIDTIEGIIRSASYLLRKEVLLNPVHVLDALVDLGERSQETLDQFWILKGYVYDKVIQSRIGLMADFLCKRYMENNSTSFCSTYYYGTEAELRRDHGHLFHALDVLGRRGLILPDIVLDGEEMSFTKRKFYIDDSVVLRGYADLDRRYLQDKKSVVRSIKKTGGDDAHDAREYPESPRLL